MMGAPPILPFPTTVTVGVSPSPFDIASINATIDRAAASLKSDERAALTVQIDSANGFGGGLIVRGPSLGPVKTNVLATVTRPMAGRWAWSGSLRASFLAGGAPASRVPVRVAPQLRGLYRMFRARGSWPPAAAIKAIAAARGLEVRLAA